jgi:hypothetical protein
MISKFICVDDLSESVLITDDNEKPCVDLAKRRAKENPGRRYYVAAVKKAYVVDGLREITP